MRNKNQEISEKAAIEAIIRQAKVLRLAMINGDRPYIVPLCFGYKDNTLYVHGAPKGLKIDLMRANPNVCFEFDDLIETVAADKACDFFMKYRSVVGTGRAIFLESPEEKRQGLGVIKSQYANKSFEFPEKMVKATAVIRIEIDSMTGRKD